MSSRKILQLPVIVTNMFPITAETTFLRLIPLQGANIIELRKLKVYFYIKVS